MDVFSKNSFKPFSVENVCNGGNIQRQSLCDSVSGDRGTGLCPLTSLFMWRTWLLLQSTRQLKPGRNRLSVHHRARSRYSFQPSAAPRGRWVHSRGPAHAQQVRAGFTIVPSPQCPPHLWRIFITTPRWHLWWNYKSVFLNTLHNLIWLHNCWTIFIVFLILGGFNKSWRVWACPW